MVSALEQFFSGKTDLAGRNFPVGGPETVYLSQLTEKLSKAWGKELKYENQTVRDFCDKYVYAPQHCLIFALLLFYYPVNVK